MNELSLLTGADSKGEKLYVDSVFSAYTYTGNGSTQTINNGIDLDGKGGMVWIKSRSTGGFTDHVLSDTLQSVVLSTNLAGSAGSGTVINSFNSNGITLMPNGFVNDVRDYVSWAFAKAPKFFDVVTYTGDDNFSGRQIAHSLGQSPGMIIVKKTSGVKDWEVWHRSLTDGAYVQLNSTAAQTGAGGFDYFGASATQTATYFTLGDLNDDGVNRSGATYVAYLFAHDTSADGMIQCGSFTTDGSGNATVNLGWEPQYILGKASSVAASWEIFDTARGLLANGNDQRLKAESSVADDSSDHYDITSTGFKAVNGNPSTTYIYLAIRRPNKPPTTGTQVYNAIARTGTGAAATVTGVGFAPDLAMIGDRAQFFNFNVSRLIGQNYLLTHQSSAETLVNSLFPADCFTVMDGIKLGIVTNVNGSGNQIINHFFKRAIGVMDIVCYTGTGSSHTESHNLDVVPELVIIKSRDIAGNWVVGHFSGNSACYMETDMAAFGPASSSGVSSLTTSSITVAFSGINNFGTKYVAYLFASKLGISKVGSYTGNGTSQTINCDFTTGSRFILIKRTDSTGDWYIWDTIRGIIGGNDPHLSLNTTSAEITTDDSIDPDTTGFIVNQLAATNINVNAGSYIFLAYS